MTLAGSLSQILLPIGTHLTDWLCKLVTWHDKSPLIGDDSRLYAKVRLYGTNVRVELQ